jgi:hypothetical protein
MTEADPTQIEVDQREPDDLRSVPVHVDGPTRVQVLPSRQWAALTRVVDTTAQKVLSADPRRSVAYLVGDAAFKVGGTSAEAEAQVGEWPAVTPLPLSHVEEVWAAAATGEVNLFMSVESWTE